MTLSISAASFLTSSIQDDSHTLRIGGFAPEIGLTPSTGVSLDVFAGKHHIINFWSAYDIESRLRNRRLALTAEDGCQIVCICTDNDTALADAIMESDGLEGKVLSLTRRDVRPSVYHDYQTDRGCRSFAVDSEGRLASIR